METTTKPTDVLRLRNIYLHPKLKHTHSAQTIADGLTQEQLQREFNDNHNRLSKLNTNEKEYKLRYSYQQFLLQWIRK